MSYNNHDPKDPQGLRFQRLLEESEKSDLKDKDYSQEGMIISIFANAQGVKLTDFIKYMKSKYLIERK